MKLQELVGKVVRVPQTVTSEGGWIYYKIESYEPESTLVVVSLVKCDVDISPMRVGHKESFYGHTFDQYGWELVRCYDSPLWKAIQGS